MRTGSSRTPWSDEAERGPQHEPDQEVDEDRDDERDVVEPHGALVVGADEAWRVEVDPADPREPRDDGDLAEEVVRDHGVRQRDHQEVDARAAAGDGAEHEADERS